jgi:predicted translin family RNA/ssDNA-binding protein
MRLAQSASLTRLSNAPIFELHYSDLDGAVKKLEAMVRAADAFDHSTIESCEHA